MRFLTRSILILSFVSFFTDISSEMLYPIMPIYLKKIGFSVVFIGILEGIAEAISGLSKGYFGKLSDSIGKRLPFVQLGYFLSSLSKPMMAIFINPIWILFARSTDRIGKGLRTAARDALLSDETTISDKAKVFGFHRGMDTLGAAIGPIIALIFLYYYPEEYSTLFYIAFIPGILGTSLTFLIKESKNKKDINKVKISFFSFLHYWKESSKDYKRLIIGLLMFSLINSSDVFLLLLLKTKGIDDKFLIIIYIFYNLVFALTSYPIGHLADKFGLKKILSIGIFIFALVYVGLPLNNSLESFFILFFLYGIYAACTEGIAKALITNIVSSNDTATALGNYLGLSSITTILASSLTGLIWNTINPETAFFVSASGAMIVLVYFFSIKINVNKT